MSDIWNSVKGLLNLNAKKIYIDNVGFRLHYKITTIILVLCGILVTSRQYFGDPIDCVTHTAYLKPILDTYCWVHGTYVETGDDLSMPIYIDRDLKPFPGILPKFESLKQYANYYQWVWIVLLIQAAFFYLPHYIWKSLEGGQIKLLVGDLNSHVLDDAVKVKHQAIVLNYFKPQSGVHKLFAAKYFLCELLCFLNVIIQILVTNHFIGNEFVKFGTEIFGNDATSKQLLNIFPYLSFCKVPVYSAGGIQKETATCVLPINVLNMKIYMLLWYWFAFVTIVSCLSIIYRFLTMMWPGLRGWRLKRCAEFADGETIDVLIRNCDIGDWFFLYELGRNMNPMYFTELLKDLSASWSDSRKDGDVAKSSLLPY